MHVAPDLRRSQPTQSKEVRDIKYTRALVTEAEHSLCEVATHRVQ